MGGGWSDLASAGTEGRELSEFRTPSLPGETSRVLGPEADADPASFEAALRAGETSVPALPPPRDMPIERLPRPMPAPVPEHRPAVTAPPTGEHVDGPAPIAAVPARLDRHGNDVDATIRETRWALGFWSSRSPDEIEPLLDHVTGVLDRIQHYEKAFDRLAPRLSEHRQARMDTQFDKTRLLGERLDDWAEDFDEMKLCEILADSDVGLKGTIDQLTYLISRSDRTFARPIRSHPMFEDRGRQAMPPEHRRDESVFSRHAGITDSLNRTASMENLFSSDLFHFKGDAQRIPGSRTAEEFGAAGAPFIGGASGTVEQIIAMMEHDRPAGVLSAEDRNQREQVIALYCAMLVAGGHHSLMEGFMPARAYGYFAELPETMNSPRHYEEAMKAIAARFPVARGGDGTVADA